MIRYKIELPKNNTPPDTEIPLTKAMLRKKKEYCKILVVIYLNNPTYKTEMYEYLKNNFYYKRTKITLKNQLDMLVSSGLIREIDGVFLYTNRPDELALSSTEKKVYNKMRLLIQNSPKNQKKILLQGKLIFYKITDFGMKLIEFACKEININCITENE